MGARAKWSGLVKAWRRSGLPAKEFAAQHRVASGTLYWWSSRLGRECARQEVGDLRLVPVEVRSDEAASITWELETVGGHVLRARGPIDEATLGGLLSALMRDSGRR